MSDLKTLVISDEWSVVYDPEDGNKMKEFLFHGNGYRIDQVVGTDSIVKAMFLNLLGHDHDDHHEYKIGPLTTVEVFKFAGLKNMSNSQAVMDAVEAALDRVQGAMKDGFTKDLESAGLRQALDTVKKRAQCVHELRRAVEADFERDSFGRGRQLREAGQARIATAPRWHRHLAELQGCHHRLHQVRPRRLG